MKYVQSEDKAQEKGKRIVVNFIIILFLLSDYHT